RWPRAGRAPGARSRGVRLQQLFENGDAELAADDRGDTERAPAFGRQPVDAREEESVQRVGDLHARGLLVRHPAVAVAGDRAAIDEHADYLLDEEGVALGFGQDKVARLLGQRVDAYQVSDQRPAVVQ